MKRTCIALGTNKHDDKYTIMPVKWFGVNTCEFHPTYLKTI